MVKVKDSNPYVSYISNCPNVSFEAGGFQLDFPLSLTPLKQAFISNLPSLLLADFSAILSKF
jgi:hypothetical protein